MLSQGLLLVVLLSQPASLPKLVGTLSVAEGKVRLERTGQDPQWAGRYVRVRVGDKITVVEKPRATLRMDLSRETFRLPEKGAWQVEERSLKVLEGAALVLLHREKPIRQTPGAKPPSMAGRIRGDDSSVKPVGAIVSGPITVTWTPAAGATKTVVELLDGAGKKLWSKRAGKDPSLGLPGDKVKPGVWIQVRVTQSGAGSPSVGSTWVRLMSPAERSALEAAEKDLRAGLADDPVALGLGLGDVWASAGLMSRLPDALALVFPEFVARPNPSWDVKQDWHGKHGEWLDMAGFPGLALAEYERAWKVGARGRELRLAIERLGGKAEPEEWEKLAAERDRLMKEGKFQEAQAVAQKVVEALRKERPESIELARALDALARPVYLGGDLQGAERAWTEALTISEELAPGSRGVASGLHNLGFVARNRGDLELAQRRHEAALAIRERLDPGSLDVAASLGNLGNVALDRGDLDLAQRRYEAALALFEKLAPGSVSVANGLFNLGVVAHERGDLDLAERCYGAALEIQEKLDPGSLNVARSLDYLGEVAKARGDLDLSERRYGAALALYEKLDPGSLDVASILGNLGLVARKRGDLELAQRRHEAALAIRERLAPGSLDVAWSLNNLGNLALDRGDLDLAQRRHEAALEIQEKLDPGSLNVARSLNNLGLVARQRGDPDLAQRRHEAALAIGEKLAPNSLDVARSLNSLGRVAYDRGDLDLAQRRYEAALALFEKLAPDSLEAAWSLHNIGNVANARGDLDLAQRRYEAALAIREKLAPGSLDVAMSLNNLGTIAWNRGNLDIAQRRYEAALAIQEELAPGSLSVAMSLHNIGNVAYDCGDLDLAQRWYEAALAIQEELAPGSLDVARSLNNLGAVAQDRGDLDEAQRRHEAALAIWEKLAPGSPDVAWSLINLGAVAQDRGDLELAQRRYEAALAIREKLAPGWSLDVAESLGAVAALRGDQSALSALESRSLELAARLLTSQGLSRAGELGRIGAKVNQSLLRLGWLDHPESSYPWLPTLRAAGLTLQTRAKISEKATEADEEVRKARSAVQIATKQETDWVTSPRPKEMDEKTWNDQLIDLRSKRQSAELALATLLKAKDPRLGTDLKIKLEDVQKNLAKDAALVEFLRVSTWDKKGKNAGPAAYAAFIVRNQGDVKFVRLGEAEAIDDLVAQWHLQIALANDPNAPESTQRETEKELKVLGRKLHDKLIKPLGKLPPSVMLAPDSALHSLPFAALVDGNGRYLVETMALSVVGSGRDLVEKPIPGEPGEIAVLAGPDFGATATALKAANASLPKSPITRAPNARGEWDPLPSASAEGARVATLLGAKPIEGAAATEERLLSLVRPRVLHIATHGFFYPPNIDPRDREDRMMSDMTGRGIRAADNPMIRSGLVMAGANQEEALRKAGLADGWATALEISLMDLRGTELVVLSACDTGRGDSIGSEGVFGLQRAFRFAGAQSLLVSLFKVPDASTQSLMTRFYGGWKPGALAGTKLKALRDTQLAMLADPQTRHPRNWSAFVLMGER